MEMKVKVLYDENCFLFDDEEGNKILVKWKKEKSELFEEFIDEYKKLNEETYSTDWNLDFYEELANRLDWRIEIQKLDCYYL